jgi:hypothetical protein
MNLFRDLEKQIDERLRRLFGSESRPNQGRELIEVQRMILDRIEERVQHLPRARRVFPYNHVAVRIPVPDPERRVAFETLFVADESLRDEVVESFRREGVEFPKDLAIQVTLADTADLTEPVLTFRRSEAAPTATAANPKRFEARRVRFVPLPDGTPVECARGRIHIGRYAEVLDERRRPVRRNDVAIDHDTVSRAHAHIDFTAGEYRLYDDGSSYGTSVLHEGALVEVPRTRGRGVLLLPGDEIYFGQARVRFEFAD